MDAAPTVPEVEEAEQELTRVPLVLHRRNFSWLTERISGVVEQPAPRWWWVAFAITASTATFGLFCIGYQISTGVGTWGNQIPVGWAWDITNFVFWIGIGHAGTLISAILFLLRQTQRSESFVSEFSRAAGADPIATGAITRWHTCFWPAFLLRWSSRCTAWYHSTSLRRLYRPGTPQSFRPISLRARSSAGSRWCSPYCYRPARSSNCMMSLRRSTSTKWQRSFC